MVGFLGFDRTIQYLLVKSFFKTLMRILTANVRASDGLTQTLPTRLRDPARGLVSTSDCCQICLCKLVRVQFGS